MEAKINVCGKEFHLLSILVGVGERNIGLNNKFSIRVTNDCNISREFDFYDSIVNYEANKEDLTEKDLKNTFRYIINDGINGGMEFEEFCDEFGYDTDSKKVENIHKLCEESLEKLNDLGISAEELLSILDELSKQGVGD